MKKRTHLVMIAILTFLILWLVEECLAQTYTLTVNTIGGGSGVVTSSPPGINCPGDCSETYASGKRVTLRAKPGSDSYFKGWSGACSGIKSCAIVMGTDSEVTAIFEEKAPIISVSAESLDFGTVEMGKKATKVLTISNLGTANLEVNISVLDPVNFSFSGRGDIIIKPKQKYNVKVICKPTSVEDKLLERIPEDPGGGGGKVISSSVRLKSNDHTHNQWDINTIVLVPLVSPKNPCFLEFNHWVSWNPQPDISLTYAIQNYIDVGDIRNADFNAQITLSGMTLTGTARDCTITGSGTIDVDLHAEYQSNDTIHFNVTEDWWKGEAVACCPTDEGTKCGKANPFPLIGGVDNTFDLDYADRASVTIPVDAAEWYGGFTYTLSCP